MAPGAIIFLSLLAFLSAPPAFILLWILHQRTHDRSVRDLSFAVLGNAFVLLGNLLTALVEGPANAQSSGVYVLLLDEVTIASIMAGAFVCRFAHRATQLRVTPALVFAFWSWAFLLHTFVLSATLIPPGGADGPNITGGYFLATIGAVLMQLYVTVLVLAGRRRITADFFIPRLSRVVLPLMLLGLVAVANDVFQFGKMLGGVGIPFSPFFNLLVNGFIIVIISRKLVSPSSPVAAAYDTKVDFGLTVRESEILPLLLEGASNEEIGERLHISPHTVKNHITVIFRKTGAESRFDLLKTLKRSDAG